MATLQRLPRQWARRAVSRWRPSGEAPRRSSIGLRLFVALALTLLLVLVANYAVARRQLERGLIEAIASEQQGTAASFARIARRSGPRALGEMQHLVDALAARPGTLEAIVIGPGSRIVAAGNRRQIGRIDRDARVAAALSQGRPFGGYEPRPSGGRQFEFITPIVLAGTRYALEVTQDDQLFAARLGGLRREKALLGLLALLLGAGAFWVAGGRAVLRSHRQALARATRDGLTDLGNHRAFQDELRRAVGLACRSGEPVALVSLDLDSFKRANDTHGHAYGDDVLRRTAAVLSRGRVGDRAFRVGGDEFSVLLPQTTAEDAGLYAERLRISLQQASVAASIGFSELRVGQDEPDTLRQEADAALYEAKRRGGTAAVSFEQIRDHVSLASPKKLRAVQRLVAEGDLDIVLQPIWDLEGDAVLGFEALARPAPAYGLSGPAEAFDLALQNGSVHALDQLCVGKALERAEEIDADTLLFVNVTPHTLDIDGGRDDWIARAAIDAGVSPARIVVEVTERSTVRSGGLVKALTQLRRDGFKLALDDAGTGSSGLEMLREVQFDFVKIDRSVVNAAVTENRARGIFLALASYARETGAVVIAEGIEDEETLSFVQNAAEGPLHLHAGVQAAQGFLLGAPDSSARLPTFS